MGSSAVGSDFEKERRELETVLASRVMVRGPNISKILAYVCERYFAGDVDSIREYNIAVDALGRKPSFDPASDSIVRVEVSRLRRRLREYYEGEGADHEIRICLPESRYVPQFVAAGAGAVSPVAPSAVADSPPPPAGPLSIVTPRIDRFWLAVGVAALLAVACLWLGWRNASLRSTAASAPAPLAAPHVDHFWRQVLGNARQSYIITSDANVMLLGNILDRPVTAHEYRISSYPRDLLEGRIRDPELLQFTSRLMSTYLTNTQDAIVAAEIRQATAHLGPGVRVVYTRDHRPLPSTPDNLILLGHRKANPSVELFDGRTNFVYEWDRARSKGVLVNRHPQPGEKPRYPVEVDRSFGTIAYLDGGAELGSVVLIGGNDMAGVEVGGRFLCHDEQLRKLYTALRTDTSRRLPSFEVLLSARRVLNVPYEPELVAWRLLAR